MTFYSLMVVRPTETSVVVCYVGSVGYQIPKLPSFSKKVPIRAGATWGDIGDVRR